MDRNLVSANAQRETTLGRPQIRCGRLATLVGDFEGHALALIEGREPCRLNGSHVNKNVLRAVGRLDEPKALLGVKPLDSTCSHFSKSSLSKKNKNTRSARPSQISQRNQLVIEQGIVDPHTWNVWEALVVEYPEWESS
jgi:hypothetical protein